jgi:hypothetical protein
VTGAEIGLRGLVARHRRALGLAGAGVAAGLAVLWLVVVPDTDGATGVQEWAIRYGHALCWALLAVAAALWAAAGPRRVVAGIAWAALACYVAFVAATLL